MASKYTEMVTAWCNEHEMLESTLDNKFVLKAKRKVQGLIQTMTPSKRKFRVKNTKHFNEWTWRAFTILHFIGQEEAIVLFMCIAETHDADLSRLSLIMSEQKWGAVHRNLQEAGETIFRSLESKVNNHLNRILRHEDDIYGFSEDSTPLESYIASLYYQEIGAWGDLSDMIEFDEKNLVMNFKELYGEIYVLWAYCQQFREEGVDDRLYTISTRAIGDLLREQPGPHS